MSAEAWKLGLRDWAEFAMFLARIVRALESRPTLRDHYAGLAMQAQVEAMGGLEGEPLEDWALFSYEMADWMINARDVRTGAARERKP